ncbi:uncharacterized protein LOC135701899 [Ochlerotatus camptorhynchus]|uniref:uncharacterized protein LOC135701899 n=1 Tax=Ochlerotatus camptorhynchus TaxID=644619 RepID=UPI0031D461E7
MNPSVALLVLSSIQISRAVVTINFDGEFNSCDNGMDSISWDISKFDILMMDNENITLDGKFSLIKDFASPTSVKVVLERNSKGMWLPTITRLIPNFCDVIDRPHEMWSSTVAYFSQRQCPFLAGHEETFDKANIGNMATNMKLPSQMMGEWRLILEIGTMREAKIEKECLKANFVLEDA